MATKDMSWLDTGRGGALVGVPRPPRIRSKPLDKALGRIGKAAAYSPDDDDDMDFELLSPGEVDRLNALPARKPAVKKPKKPKKPATNDDNYFDFELRSG